MKTLHNIWDLEQLTNNTLIEIAYELDKLHYGQYDVNYKSYNKSELVGAIYNELLGVDCNDMTEMIDYLIELVKDGKIELPNH